jgi:hypothetical protein
MDETDRIAEAVGTCEEGIELLALRKFLEVNGNFPSGRDML